MYVWKTYINISIRVPYLSSIIRECDVFWFFLVLSGNSYFVLQKKKENKSLNNINIFFKR